MADTVASNVLFNGPRHYAIQITCVSDGTGETAVTKVDISTLTLPNGTACTNTALEEISWDVQGFTYVKLYWDRTSPKTIDLLAGRGSISYRDVGYLFDSAAGGTGDVLLTSVGAVSGATYDITLVFQLR